MNEDLQSLLPVFNNTDSNNPKKQRSKKESFLLKFQLFTLIFQKKGEQNFNEIVDKIKLVQYGFAYEIFNESKHRIFTYIVRGLVMVFVQKVDDPIATPMLYKKMGPNQHFGEKVLYNNNQKLHSVKSVSKTYALELDLQTFYKTFSGHFKYHQLQQKVQFLKKIWIFSQTNNNQIERILHLSKPYRYIKNTILFKQGDKPTAVYVVIEGQLTLFKRNTQTQGQSKYQPFMILTKGEICACEEVLEKSVIKCGGTVTTSQAVLLKINAELFLDIFQDKVDNQIISERNQVKQKLIEVKSKKSITLSLKKLKQTEKLLQQKSKPVKQRRIRYHTQQKSTQIANIFDITKGSISWQNQLKNRKLRQFTLRERVQKQKARTSMMRLSTMTNHSFTNDKELLLSYLIRKERTEKKAEDWERAYEREVVHPVRELIVQTSSAIKTQKRKMKQSRRKNAASMPTLI